MINIIHSINNLVCPSDIHTEFIPFEKRELFKNIDDLKVFENITGDFYILKHSNICSISHAAYNRVLGYMTNGYLKDIPVYLVVVQENREFSKSIAEYFEVIHESPQLIHIQNKKAITVKNHHEI